jgi:hypothetical protein
VLPPQGCAGLMWEKLGVNIIHRPITLYVQPPSLEATGVVICQRSGRHFFDEVVAFTSTLKRGLAGRRGGDWR